MADHGCGYSAKAPKKRWTGKVEYPLTSEYERGYAATFGKKEDRYCKGCGRLPAFCECIGKSTRQRAVEAVAVNTIKQCLP